MNDRDLRRSDRATRSRPGVANARANSSLASCVLQSCVSPITRLDALIRNKFARNPDKLAAWQSASHVERGPKKASLPEATPPAQQP